MDPALIERMERERLTREFQNNDVFNNSEGRRYAIERIYDELDEDTISNFNDKINASLNSNRTTNEWQEIFGIRFPNEELQEIFSMAIMEWNIMSVDDKINWTRTYFEKDWRKRAIIRILQKIVENQYQEEIRQLEETMQYRRERERRERERQRQRQERERQRQERERQRQTEQIGLPTGNETTYNGPANEIHNYFNKFFNVNNIGNYKQIIQGAIQTNSNYKYLDTPLKPVIDHITNTSRVAQKAAEDAQKVAEDAQKVAEDAQKAAEDAQKVAEDAQQVAKDIYALKDAINARKYAKMAAIDARNAEENAQKVTQDAENTFKDAQKAKTDAKNVAEFNRKFMELYNKLTPDYKELILDTIQFVFMQEDDFVERYIAVFREDCAKAYNNNGVSCHRGIIERVFVSLKDTVLTFCLDKLSGPVQLNPASPRGLVNKTRKRIELGTTKSGKIADGLRNAVKDAVCKQEYEELYYFFFPPTVDTLLEKWYNQNGDIPIPEEEDKEKYLKDKFLDFVRNHKQYPKNTIDKLLEPGSEFMKKLEKTSISTILTIGGKKIRKSKTRRNKKNRRRTSKK